MLEGELTEEHQLKSLGGERARVNAESGQATPRRDQRGKRKLWVFPSVNKELRGRCLGIGEMVKFQSNVISANKKKANDGKTGRENKY